MHGIKVTCFTIDALKILNKKNFFIETVGFYIQKLFQLFCFTVFELLISERHSSSHSPEHLHYYKEI